MSLQSTKKAQIDKQVCSSRPLPFLPQPLPMQEDKKTDMIYKFMQISNLDLQTSKKMMIQSNFDMNTALERMLGGQLEFDKTKSSIQKKADSKQSKIKEFPAEELIDLKQQAVQRKDPNHVSKQELERLENERKRNNYKKTYVIKRSNVPKKRSQLKYKSKDLKQAATFKEQLENYVNGPVSINFYEEASQLFEEHWTSRKLIAMHCLNLNPPASQKDMQNQVVKFFIRDVYSSQKYGSIFNKQFLNFVIDPKTEQFQLYPQFKSLIDAQKDQNVIVVLRIDERTKMIKKVCRWNIFQTINPAHPESLKKSIMVMKKDTNRAIDQEICSNIHHNPLSYLDKKKLDEDRKIRKEQEEAFLETEKQALKQAESKDRERRKERAEQGQESDEEIELMKQEVITCLRDQIDKQRAIKRQNLKIYQKQELAGKTFALKLRLPNGHQEELFLPKNQNISYVFEYIECLQGELGFENQMKRSFYLLQPWSDTKIYQNSKQRIEQMFPGSEGETLIIKQDD